MSETIQFDRTELDALGDWFDAMANSTDGYEFAEFEIAPGITVSCDWSMEYDEPTVPITIVVTGEGFEHIDGSAGKTLSDTESVGEEIALAVTQEVYDNFTTDYYELPFEYHGHQSEGGRMWLFTAWVTNPNGTFEGY